MTAWIVAEVGGFDEYVGPFPSGAHAAEFQKRLRLDGQVVEAEQVTGIKWSITETEAFHRADRS